MKQYISTYALYHPNDAYLEHGLSWGKHRYIKRTGTPGNYKYTYAEDLRNAGRNLASGARNLVSRAGAAASNAASRVRRTVRNGSQAAPSKNGLQRSLKSIKQALSQKMSSLKESFVNAGKNIVDKIRFAIIGPDRVRHRVRNDLETAKAAIVSKIANTIGSAALATRIERERRFNEAMDRQNYIEFKNTLRRYGVGANDTLRNMQKFNPRKKKKIGKGTVTVPRGYNRFQFQEYYNGVGGH